jgi:hypothetical protein
MDGTGVSKVQKTRTYYREDKSKKEYFPIYVKDAIVNCAESVAGSFLPPVFILFRQKKTLCSYKDEHLSLIYSFYKPGRIDDKVFLVFLKISCEV